MLVILHSCVARAKGWSNKGARAVQPQPQALGVVLWIGVGGGGGGGRLGGGGGAFGGGGGGGGGGGEEEG